MLSKLKISQRIVLLGVMPLLLLLAVLFASFHVSNTKDKLFHTLYDDHLAILPEVMATKAILQQDLLVVLRKYRTGWASAKDTETEVNTLLDKVAVNWQSFVDRRPIKAEDDTTYQVLDASLERAIKQYKEWISYAGSDALLIKILNESTVNGEIERFVAPFTTNADVFIQQQIVTGAVVREQALSFTALLVKTYSIGGAGITLVILWLIWLIQASVCRPLNALKSLLMRIADSSDLRLKATVSGDDEIAQASIALNSMLEHFNQLVATLGGSSTTLSQHAWQVHDISEKVSSGSSRQAEQAAQLATAIEQMSQAVHQVALNARSASQNAEDAAQLSIEGRNIAADSSDTITTLEKRMQEAKMVISQLQKDSSKISSVLEVIQKISEQTNLLALNAAIEAARAGDAGRGFSVVADEVRTLSANTQEATESIKSMVSQLQSQANAAVTVMQSSAEQAILSVERSQQADAMFTRIHLAVQKIVEVNAQISRATDEQHQVASSIAESINILNADINQLTQGASQSAHASDQLNSLAEQLSLGLKGFNKEVA